MALTFPVINLALPIHYQERTPPAFVKFSFFKLPRGRHPSRILTPVYHPGRENSVTTGKNAPRRALHAHLPSKSPTHRPNQLVSPQHNPTPRSPAPFKIATNLVMKLLPSLYIEGLLSHQGAAWIAHPPVVDCWFLTEMGLHQNKK